MITMAARPTNQFSRRCAACSCGVSIVGISAITLYGISFLISRSVKSLPLSFSLAKRGSSAEHESHKQAHTAQHQSPRLVGFRGQVRRIQHAEMFPLLRLLQVGRHLRLVFLGEQRIIIGFGLIVVAVDVGKLLLHHRSHVQAALVLGDFTLQVPN